MKTVDLHCNKPGNVEKQIALSSAGDQCHYVGIVDARTAGEYKVRVVIDHLVPNTSGRVEVRGVVGGGAVLNLSGLVKIAKGAIKTDSFLSLKILILDDISMAVAEPELQIENNDVKASHSASVGRVDEDQIMYLMSRGLDRESSRNLIIEGFLSGNG